MKYLVTLPVLILLQNTHCYNREKRSIFSWFRSEDESKLNETFIPVLEVHKYNGNQINPMNGGQQVFFQSLSPITREYTAVGTDQHFANLLYNMEPFLPEEDNLSEFDLTPFLPYVNSIPDDSIDRLQFFFESSSNVEKGAKKKSKLLKFLHLIKDKKLKAFKKLYNRKKEVVPNVLNSLRSSITSPIFHSPLQNPSPQSNSQSLPPLSSEFIIPLAPLPSHLYVQNKKPYIKYPLPYTSLLATPPSYVLPSYPLSSVSEIHKFENIHQYQPSNNTITVLPPGHASSQPVIMQRVIFQQSEPHEFQYTSFNGEAKVPISQTSYSPLETRSGSQSSLSKENINTPSQYGLRFNSMNVDHDLTLSSPSNLRLMPLSTLPPSHPIFRPHSLSMTTNNEYFAQNEEPFPLTSEHFSYNQQPFFQTSADKKGDEHSATLEDSHVLSDLQTLASENLEKLSESHVNSVPIYFEKDSGTKEIVPPSTAVSVIVTSKSNSELEIKDKESNIQTLPKNDSAAT